jgi:hypothetical protein
MRCSRGDRRDRSAKLIVAATVRGGIARRLLRTRFKKRLGSGFRGSDLNGDLVLDRVMFQEPGFRVSRGHK